MPLHTSYFQPHGWKAAAQVHSTFSCFFGSPAGAQPANIPRQPEDLHANRKSGHSDISPFKKRCFTLIVSPKINLDWVYELYIEMHNVFADI